MISAGPTCHAKSPPLRLARRLSGHICRRSSYLPRLLVNHQPLVVWLWTIQISALVILRNCRNTPTKLLVHITTRGRTIRRPSMLYRSLARDVII
ncbi:hypothetical protein BJX62DRAFT_220804 [Aspergillus germanicus]